VSARLFAALELPGEVRAELARWRDGVLAQVEGLRAVREEGLHVTLVFLGHRPEEDVPAIGEAVTEAVAPVGEMVVGASAWLPPRRPRVLAVDLENPDGSCAALQARVSEALVRVAGYEPEQRPFRAHVTVARVRGRERVRPVELEPPAALRFTPSALVLYRSRLERGGARYEPVVRVALS
jgi:RNA 2',3'-cyclic 3'-phosphodiesterase